MDEEHRPSKEPWLAVSLSWLLSGLGQFYAGAWIWGAAFLFGCLGLALAGQWQLGWAEGRLVWAIWLFAGALLVRFAGVFQAYYAARRRNSSEAEAARRRSKDPFLAVFLTLIVPGIGHLYLGRWVVGILLILGAGALVLGGPVFVAAAGLGGGLLFHAVGFFAYEAGAALLAYRAKGPASRRRPRGILAVCLLTFFLGLLPLTAALLLREHVIEAFHVPTGSNAPTIQPDDRVLVWKMSYEPRRGDLIVYRTPHLPDTTYIKRLAALPGELVEVRSGGVYVDGERLTEGSFGEMRSIQPPPPPMGPATGGEGEPFTVPEGHVFVLGDNIDRSFDSRYHGPVPAEDVIGRAYKRYWPPSREGPIE